MSFFLDSAYSLKTYSLWPDREDRGELRKIFSDPGFRNEFREALEIFDSTLLFTGRWDWVSIAVAGLEKNADLEGRNIAEIAAQRGVDPLDLFFDLGLEEDFGTKYTFFMLNMVEEGVAELLVNDGTLISLSDAGAHN